jgi:uncharacterized protein YkwD
MIRTLAVLLVVSLATGGFAQWGWDRIKNSPGGASSLFLSGPDRTAEAETTPGGDRIATPSSGPRTSAVRSPSPGKRASRGAERTATAPAAGAATKPAPKPSVTRPKTRSAKPGPTADEREAMENEVIALTNAERSKKKGCRPLRPDNRLRDAARGHSTDMRNRDYFDHVTPSGQDPWERAKAEGYDEPSGENIARGQPTPTEVVKAWMNSQGHRDNILNCDSKAIGVGVATGQGGPWWTQMFGFA